MKERQADRQLDSCMALKGGVAAREMENGQPINPGQEPLGV